MALIPARAPVEEAAIDALSAALRGRQVAVLTGAGMSTESGIPDYRGEGTRARARNPVQYRAFVDDPGARRRYWARATLGWPSFRARSDNAAHRALATLERADAVVPLMTQNVDRLHQKAGSREVIELHGALAEVVCLSCQTPFSRDQVHGWMLELNPGFAPAPAETAPDGDVELEDTEGFVVASCPRCSGVLKPHVVFFGESVPRERVEQAFRRVESADALLILGTSLAVYSGFRFARRAHERGLPIHVVNAGPTRADVLATSRIDGRVGDVLPRLVAGIL